jgi:hypothetical protein
MDSEVIQDVIIDFAEASTPKSEIAKRLAAEAQEQANKPSDKKSGRLSRLSSNRSDMFSINPYLVKIKEGWNSRVASSPDNIEHIETLARSIAEVGVLTPLTVVIENDDVYVTDGHCRLLATFHAIEVHGAEIKSIPVRSESRYASEADRILRQLLTGKPLSVLEQGVVFVKLTNLGWSHTDIAKKSGMGPGRVSQVLDFMAESTPGIKKMVTEGVVAATTAAKAIRDAGGDAQEAEQVLKEAAELAELEGKDHVTPKLIKEAEQNAADIEEAEGEAAKVKSKRGKRETVERVLGLKAFMKGVFEDPATDVDTTDTEETGIVHIAIPAHVWKEIKSRLAV